MSNTYLIYEGHRLYAESKAPADILEELGACMNHFRGIKWFIEDQNAAWNMLNRAENGVVMLGFNVESYRRQRGCIWTLIRV